MRSRDRECAHHHNKGRFRFEGEDVYLCCLFFLQNRVLHKIDYGSLRSFGVNISSCTKTDWASSIYPEAIYSTAPPATNYT